MHRLLLSESILSVVNGVKVKKGDKMMGMMYVFHNSLVPRLPDLFQYNILKTWEWPGDEATFSTCDLLLLSMQ